MKTMFRSTALLLVAAAFAAPLTVPAQTSTDDTMQTKHQLKEDRKAEKAQAHADKKQRKALDTNAQKKADKAQDKASRKKAEAGGPTP